MSSNLSPGGYVRHGQRSTSPPRSVNVQVAVRCRPLNDREKTHGERSILVCDENRREVQFAAPTAVRKNNAPASNNAASNGKKTFTYDQVFGPHASQADVYEGLVEPIVDEVLQGYNCTVFAYGQTGTGKTHTMEGRRDADMPDLSERRLATNAGIIPRAVKQVFDHLRSLTDEHSVRVSHLELYNEQLTDLLGPEEMTSDSLRVYEDPQKGTFVQGLEDIVVRSEEEIFAVLDRSATKRKTAETLMNKYSSRSHSIFSITIHIKESTPEGADLLKVGKLNLVDLAGSENIGRSGAVKGRAREAGNINQSLLTLGRVITALVDRHPHIPYRDSKLTRLLQESLGGRNKTCVIATVTPGSNSFEETASTLDYAYRAKSIKNRPTVNQMIAKHVLLKEYTEELAKLKRELDATRAKNGVYLPPEEFERLQRTSSQQREEIGQLEAQSEEYERKLGAVKEKLERTQVALVRDQRLLAETRQTLTAVTSELNETNARLKVASQQKEENATLVRSHVATEQSLYNQATHLQETLSTSISDCTSLHRRVSAKAELEARNVRSLSQLKGTIESGVADLCETLEQQKGQQRSQIEVSVAKLEEMTATLESGLSSMNESVESVLSEILHEEQEAGRAASEAEKDATYKCAEKTRAMRQGISAQADVLSEKSQVILQACRTMSNCFLSSQAAVSDIRDAVKDYASVQTNQLEIFEDDQRKVLADFHHRVSAACKRQASILDEMKDFHKRESDLEIDALKNAKSLIIDKITSALDVLVEDTVDRAARRNENVDLCATSLVTEGTAIEDSMTELQVSHTERFCRELNAASGRVSSLEQKLSDKCATHERYTAGANKAVVETESHIGELHKASEESNTALRANLGETETLLADFQNKAEERRRRHHKTSVGNVGRARASIKSAVASATEAASESHVAAGNSLGYLRNEVTAGSTTVKGMVQTQLHEPITAHEIVRDLEHDTIPPNREWPAPAKLARTRSHGSIIAEKRRERGLPDVPRENFGYDKCEEDENAAPFDPAAADPCTQRGPVDEKDEASQFPVEEAETAEENMVSASAPEQGGRKPEGEISASSSDASFNEQLESNILSDTTNRRPRTRAKKKLEHVIRKKPSGIPIPRGRSSTRKIGM